MEYKIALIRWVDSQIGPQEWHTIEEQDNYCPVITSVGHIVGETDDCFVLYGSVIHYKDDRPSSGAGSITIPKGCIVQIDVIGDTK